MRLATVQLGGTSRAVALVDGGAVELGRRTGRTARDVGDVMAGGWLDEARAASLVGDPDVPLDEIEWLPVVPRPEHIFCIGLNYIEHRVETGTAGD